MTVDDSRVALLLHADPAFAAGAGSFSSGLETLAAEEWITTADTLEEVLREALAQRWNSFDRVFLARAYAAAPDPDHLLTVDSDLNRHLIGEAARTASRRAGGALLGVWARLEDPEASQMRARSPEGVHLPVAQALIAKSHGLSLEDMETLAGWAVVSSYASSAVRLGISGHRRVQHMITRAATHLRTLLDLPIAAGTEPVTWTPRHDIAMERHQNSGLRLFAS